MLRRPYVRMGHWSMVVLKPWKVTEYDSEGAKA